MGEGRKQRRKDLKAKTCRGGWKRGGGEEMVVGIRGSKRDKVGQ